MELGFRFEETSKKMQQDIYRYVMQHGSSVAGSKTDNFNVITALYNPQENFWLTQNFYLSECIKRCGEPDDYEFVVWKDGACCIVQCWFGSPFRIIRITGNRFFSDDAFRKAAALYNQEYYHWATTEMYRKNLAVLERLAMQG